MSSARRAGRSVLVGYFESPNSARIWAASMRVPAPCLPRHSSMTTPRSRSISEVSSEMPPAKSLSASSPRATPPRGRSGLEHVNRLIKARVGVDVWPEASADRFQIVDELTRLEVGRAVECHVLEQVREAALIIGLVYRTIDDQAQCRVALAASCGE